MAKEKMFTVLSIDGGGIRGIIPATILAYIEEQAGLLIEEQGESQNEEPVEAQTADLFDLIAGTSTGGIIALALTMPDSNGRPAHTAEDLVGLYRDQGEIIFDRSVWHRIRSAGGWTEEKYPTRGIRRVLKNCFENTRLNQACTEVLIPSYDMRGTRPYWEGGSVEREGGHPRFFKSSKAGNPNQPHEDYLMREIAHATAAAPTYFEPVDTVFTPPLEESRGERLVETLVDGGIFANNPAMCAYVEAKRILREKNRTDKILLVSLGTGNLTEELDANDAKNWGKVSWINPLFTMIFDGASDTVDYQLKQLTVVNGDIYYRFQPSLSEEGNDEMDDANPAHLSELKRFADSFIGKRREDLRTLSCQLLENAGIL